jgi:hypothetical protein
MDGEKSVSSRDFGASLSSNVARSSRQVPVGPSGSSQAKANINNT